MDKAAFYKWWAKYRQFDEPPVFIPVPNLNEIWDYFAPYLQGEFPREAIGEVVVRIVRDCANNHPVVLPDLLDALERLWNRGKEDGECKSCDGKGCKKCDARYICPTCKGSGEKPRFQSCSSRHNDCSPKRNPTHWKPCPDCTEKPSRTNKGRDGQRRKGAESTYTILESGKGIWRLGQFDNYRPDNRKKDRRKSQ